MTKFRTALAATLAATALLAGSVAAAGVQGPSAVSADRYCC